MQQRTPHNAQQTQSVPIAPLWVMAPTTICGLVFLVVLDQRLRLPPRHGFSWGWVFFSLWLGDVYTLWMKSIEVYRLRESMESAGRFDHRPFLKPACALVDTLGAFVTKILLAYYLDHLGEVRMTLFVVLAPVWVSAAVSTCLRCASPIVRIAGRSVLRFRLPLLMGALYYILGRGIQPLLLVLKLEGAMTSDWRGVFAPAWILIFSEFLTATVLCHCAPMVHASTPRSVRAMALRLMVLTGLQLYLMAICSFLFLYWLTARLYAEESDKEHKVAVLQIVSPLIAMSVVLIFLHPTMLYYSQRYQMAFRANLAELAAATEGGRTTGQLNRSILLEARSTPTYLMQMSGTLYAPLADKSLPLTDVSLDPEALSMLAWETPLTDDSSDGKLDNVNAGDIELGRTSPGAVVGLLDNLAEDNGDSCIICFTRAPNAVLMDCGHGGLCIDCARAVAQRAPGVCPVCRNRISAVLQLTGFHELADGRVLACSREGYEVREATVVDDDGVG